jgi:release factor glutamine methyltransferase
MAELFNLYQHHGLSASYESTTSSAADAASLTWEDLNDDAEILAKQAQRQQQSTNSNMPRLDHLSLRDYDEVYEPSDDTFLLLDAIQYEFQNGTFDEYFKKNRNNASNNNNTQQQHPTCIVLEIGCGTGVASVFFRSQWIKRWETLLDDMNDVDVVISSSRDYDSDQTAADLLASYATDINPKAIQVTLQTDSYNNGHVFHEDVNPIRVVQCDLATDLLAQLKGKVDVLLFNPPYVPTDDSEVVDLNSTTTTNSSNDDDDNNEDFPSPSIITAAWAGGKDGRRVIDRAMPQIAQLLRRPSNNASRSGSDDDDDDDKKADGGKKTTCSTDEEDGTCNTDNDGSPGDTGGVLYLVTVDDNRPAQLAAHLSTSLSLEMKPLFRRRARNEFLTIQKIAWEKKKQPSSALLRNYTKNNDQHSMTGTEQQTMSESASSSLLS